MDAQAEPSDAELARRIGREAGRARARAEAELCARFAPRIRAYGRRHLGDASAADDLVQRVLLLVLTKLRAGEVRDPEAIASFVLGSARLTAAAMRRDGRRLERAADAEDVIEIAVPAPEPIDRERLAAGLNRLSERERSVIVRTFFEDASAAEIAESLGIEPGHVRVVRHRALARLRAELERRDEVTR